MKLRDADDRAPNISALARRVVGAATGVQLSAVIADNRLLQGLGLGELVPQFDANLRATNPHLRHADSTHNGFAIIAVGPDALDVTFVSVGDVTSPHAQGTSEAAFRTPAGSRRVLDVSSATSRTTRTT